MATPRPDSEALPELDNARYAISKKLGEGGQATTFEAVDKREGKLVVLKRFRVRGAASWKEVELAEREANVLASIRHPNLPRYVEHFEEKGELFLVTEKIEGQSLAARRKEGASFGANELARFLDDAREALDYLHGRAPPVVHRDIKPSNVIARPDGSFAFIDFGSVRDRLKPEGGSTVVGTFGYMAPEQFQGRSMPASDVYAVGVTALVLLTGREPEDLPHKGLGLDVPAALRGLSVRPELVAAITAMVEVDPDKRATRVPHLVKGKVSNPDAGRPARREAKWEAFQAEVIEHEVARAQRTWRDLRDAARDAKRAARAERREARHAGRKRGARLGNVPRHGRFWDGRGAPPGLVAIARLALLVAEVAVTLVLRVLLPIGLTALSVVFGRALRDAAREVGGAGKRAGTVVRYARRALEGRVPTVINLSAQAEERGSVRASTPAMRIDDLEQTPLEKPRIRVEAAGSDDELAEAEAEVERELARDRRDRH